MFVIVMAIFVIYGAFFILFEDYDRRVLAPLADQWDWHLLWFSLVVVAVLAFVLHRYSRRMDERISKEQAEQQNRMRRELTQNIAHELKTPVASILGYMETLIDNPDIEPDTRTQFLERSHSQARRLTALLQDISTLNRMDYAPDLLERETVDLSRLVADIASETSLSFVNRNMVFLNNLPDGICVVGNRSLLYSIFRNLTDNAICYAGDGTHITITAEATPTHWRFRFSDNGVGIAARHLPRLFERFYRIDTGRSRSMGGTGLGLAIVKNAVIFHGGTITAHSVEGKGLQIEFTLSR